MKRLTTAETIQLTRIHAIQWYGFCDSFDLIGQTVITGVYGCGKTGLVDLMQTVLLGPPERETRYNLALAGIGDSGKTVKRDLRGYCLQDLNVTEHGHPVYARKSSRSYIALEFTWPDNKRRETWGIRVEYTSTGADPHFIYWKVPARVDYGEFLGHDEIPLSADDWEAFLEKHKQRPFATRDLYLENMAAAQHLHFNRRILKPLVLQTLRFSFGKDFTEFCRNHILAEDVIDLAEVRASFDHYKGLIDRMRLLQEHEIVLDKIHELFEQQRKFADEERAFLWYRQHYLVEDAKQDVARREKESTDLKAKATAWLKKQEELLGDKAAAEKDLGDATRQLRQDPNASDFEGMKKRQKALPREIEDLKGSLADPVAELRQKHKRCLALWDQAQQAARVHGWEIVESSLSTTLPTDLGASQLSQQIVGLTLALDPLAKHFDDIARRLEPQRESLNGKVVSLRKDIARLKEHKQVEGLFLHEALLAKFGPDRVKLIGSICEVTDPAWADALELNFIHKFASLVSDDDIKPAFEILHKLPRVNGRERLLCNGDLRAMHGTVKSGSLAEKIGTQNQDVRRLLAHLLGDVMCCTTVDEAERASRAILPNGTVKEPGGRRRQRTEPTEYLIGESGRKRMIAAKQADLTQLEAQLDRMTSQANAARGAADGFQQTKQALLQLSADKVELLRQLEEKCKEQDEVQSVLGRIENRDELEKLLQRKNRAETKVDGAVTELSEHGAKQPGGLAGLEMGLRTARDQLTQQKTTLLRWQVENPEEYDAASRNQSLREEIEKEISPQKSGSVVAELLGQKRRTSKVEVQGELRDKRKMLKIDLRTTDYRDIDEIDYQDNTLCDKKLAFIRDSGIRDLRKDADQAEVEWEDRFQRQVLGRLAQGLSEIRATFDSLRRIISGQEIGGATYEFTYRAVERADFERLRLLAAEVETDGLLAPDDPMLVARKDQRRAAMDSLVAKANDPKSAERARDLLDARQYFSYDMLIQEAGRTEKVSLEKRGRKGSGGETYNPYFIALMTAYLRAYWRHDAKARPSISLLLMDEAFKVLNSEAVRDCVQIIRELGLQGVISCTDTNGGQIVEFFQWVMIVQKQVTPGGKGEHDEIENSIYAASREDAEIVRLLDDIT
jgi:hypothetical protein